MKIYSANDLEGKTDFVIKVLELDDYHSKVHRFQNLKEPFVLRKLEYNNVTGIDENYRMIYYQNNLEDIVYIPKTFKFIQPLKSKRMTIIKSWEEFKLSRMFYELAHTWSIGSDPEIFVSDEKGVIPAFNFLTNKADVKCLLTPSNELNGQLDSLGRTKMYWDGFQAEFETWAGRCIEEHLQCVRFGLMGILQAAKKVSLNAKLLAKPTVDVPFNLVREGKEEHVAFGCTPSKNIYGMKGKEIHGRDVFDRSAGGHIHFGCGSKTEEEIKKIVNALDSIIGVACVSLFAKFDDQRRRIMYGLAGEYRTPNHGIEYRTLSNAWLYHPLIANIVIDVARKAFMFGEKGFMKYWKTPEETTIKCINTCDVALAKQILSENKEMFLKVLNAVPNYMHYNLFNKETDTYTQLVFNIFLNGMESVIEDPTNIEKNWQLELQYGEWIRLSRGPGKNFKNSVAMLLEGKKV